MTHVPATSEDLRRAVGDPAADPQEVGRAFVAALRVSPRRLRKLLSTRSREFRSSEAAEVPGYFAYLVLTCHVAAGGEGVISEGQFRERLRLTMGHRPGTSYDLPELGRLWEHFEAWLAKRADRGECRRLILPDPGSFNRIGYSLRLAFPTLRDRRALAETLSDAYDGDPPAREVVRRVRARRQVFTRRFLEVFDDFRERYERGELALRDHPFWSAVRDAASTEYERAGQHRLRFTLFLPDPSALDPAPYVGCDAAPGEVPPPSGVRLTPTAVERFGSVVTLGGAESPSPRAATAELLAGRLGLRWRALAGSSLASTVAQGVLLFCRDDAGWPVLQYAKPEPGRDVWVLARRHRLRQILLWSFEEKEGAPAPRPSPFPDWAWIGPFDSSNLSDPLSLRDVACLRPTIPGPALWPVGGVRTGGAYLGLPRALPRVKAPGATSVRAKQASAGRDLLLQRSGTDSFSFAVRESLEGDFVVVATRGDDEVGRLHLRFVSGHVGVAYKEPSDPHARTESADVETVPWADVVESALGGAFPYGFARARRSRSPAPKLGRLRLVDEGDVEPVELVASASDTCADFTEVAAARATRRAGLPEHEFLSLLREVLGVPEGHLLWAVERAWVEAGYFDCLTGWGGHRTFFAQPPRLITWRDSGSPAATLVGLAPSAERERLRTEAVALGLDVTGLREASPWVLPSLTVRAPDRRAFDDLARAAELPPTAQLRPFSAFVTPPSILVAEASGDGAPGYELRGRWVWNRNYFAGSGEDGSDGVVLDWLDHPRMPSTYRVRWKGRSRHFRSRNWAFLCALALRGDVPFAFDGAGHVVRAVTTPVYLPLPVARALACAGGATPGPCTLTDGTPSYAYGCVGDTLTRSLSAALGAAGPLPPKAAALARFVTRQPRPPGLPALPIPSHLEAALRRFEHDHDVAQVLQSRVPATLVPHLSKLAALLDAA